MVEEIRARLTFKKQLVMIVISILILGVGAGGFTYLGNRTDASPYVTVALERGNIDRLVTATGTLNPVVSVKVGTQVSGTIKQLNADYNSVVKKDQVMAILDPATFEAQVAKAKAGVESAEKNLDKGRADLENAKINFQNSLAKLAQDRANQVRAEAALLSERAGLEKARIMAQDARVKLDRTSRLVKEGIMAESEKDTAQANYDAAVAQVRAAEGQVEAASAQVEAAKAQVRAGESLVNSARSQVESAEINLKYLASKSEEARADLDLAQVNLDRTVIKAPIDGIVVSRDVDVGQTVAASLQSPTLFSMAGDLSKMEVYVSTDEADVGSIALGQPATFTVDAFPGEVFQGEVTEVRLSPIISQNVVTYNTVVRADNPQLKLKPGMTANVSILVQRKENVLRLLNAALRFIPPDADKLLKGFESGPPTGPPDGRGAGLPQMRGQAPGGPGVGRGGGPPGMRGPGQGLARGPAEPGKGGPRVQRVWVLGEDKKPRPARVLLGTSDGTFTEVLRGGVTEGQQIIVRMASKDKTPPPDAQPGLPRGFGPPMGRF